MTVDATHDDLIDALRGRGCAVCRLTTRRGDRFLTGYCEQHVTDVEVRATLRGARGFCERHGQALLDKLDTLAVAITYRDILQTLLEDLGRLDGRAARLLSGSRWRLRRPYRPKNLRPPDTCPACVAEAMTEARVLDVLAQSPKQPRLRQAVAAGDPLCLAHLRGLLERGPQSSELMARQRTGWSELRDQLREIIRKSDHRYRAEDLTDAERQAIRAAVEAVAGVDRRPADDAAAQHRRLHRGGTNARRAPRPERGEPAS